MKTTSKSKQLTAIAMRQPTWSSCLLACTSAVRWTSLSLSKYETLSTSFNLRWTRRSSRKQLDWAPSHRLKTVRWPTTIRPVIRSFWPRWSPVSRAFPWPTMRSWGSASSSKSKPWSVCSTSNSARARARLPCHGSCIGVVSSVYGRVTCKSSLLCLTIGKSWPLVQLLLYSGDPSITMCCIVALPWDQLSHVSALETLADSCVLLQLNLALESPGK